MEEYKVRRFVRQRSKRTDTRTEKDDGSDSDQSHRSKRKENSPVRFRAGRTSIKWDQCK